MMIVMAYSLFAIGTGMSVVVLALVFTKGSEDTKKSAVASPFMFLLAAAVAKYLGS